MRCVLLLVALVAGAYGETKHEVVDGLQRKVQQLEAQLSPPLEEVLLKLGVHATAIFSANGITSVQELLLLDHTQMERYLHLDLGTRLRVMNYINEQKQNLGRAASTTGSCDAAAAERAAATKLVSALLKKQDEQDTHRQEIARMIAENNAKLLEQVQTMIDAAAARLTSSSSAPPAHQQPRLLSTGNPEAADNLEGASLWVEEDGAKICFGSDASVNLHRPATGEGYLSISGGVRVGKVDNLACTTDRAGVLRWAETKKALQVCGKGEKWRAAGGAVLDAGDGEPCSSETPGALQWNNDADKKVLEVCDGVDTYQNVLLAGAGAQALGDVTAATLATTGHLQVGSTSATCGEGLKGGLRYDATNKLLEMCTDKDAGSWAWGPIYEPPPPPGSEQSAAAVSCKTLLSLGVTASGLYWLTAYSANPSGLQVYCDQTGDGVRFNVVVCSGVFFVTPLQILNPHCHHILRYAQMLLLQQGGWALVSRIRGNNKQHDATDSNAFGTLTAPDQSTAARLDNSITTALKSNGDGLVRLFCGPNGKIFTDHWQNYRSNGLPSNRHFKFGINDGWSSCHQGSSDHTAVVSTTGRCNGSADSRDASYGCRGCEGCSQGNHQWGQDGTLWVR